MFQGKKEASSAARATMAELLELGPLGVVKARNACHPRDVVSVLREAYATGGLDAFLRRAEELGIELTVKRDHKALEKPGTVDILEAVKECCNKTSKGSFHPEGSLLLTAIVARALEKAVPITGDPRIVGHNRNLGDCDSVVKDTKNGVKVNCRPFRTLPDELKEIAGKVSTLLLETLAVETDPKSIAVTDFGDLDMVPKNQRGKAVLQTTVNGGKTEVWVARSHHYCTLLNSPDALECAVRARLDLKKVCMGVDYGDREVGAGMIDALGEVVDGDQYRSQGSKRTDPGKTEEWLTLLYEAAEDGSLKNAKEVVACIGKKMGVITLGAEGGRCCVWCCIILTGLVVGDTRCGVV